VLRRPARAERGFMMVTVMLTMVVVLGLSVAVGSAALHVTSTGERTDFSAQALAAAQAGEQVALFRLNTTAGATGATGALGSGATYSYTVSTLASQSSSCTGLWLQNSSSTLNQDCITSTGTRNGVSERIQSRVAAFKPTALFPVNGLFTADGLTAAGAVTGSFNLGSNGPMTFNNSIGFAGDLQYLSGDLSGPGTCSGSCVPQVQSKAITLPSVPATAYSAAATSNSDASVSWAADGLTYTASNHTVSDPNGTNNVVVALPAGTYYFCEMNLGGGSGATLDPTSFPVKIYIDSSYDGSACGSVSPSGQMAASNGFTISNSSGASGNVQVYFYGDPSCTTESCLSSNANDFSPNASTITADVWAPYSYAQPGGAFSMTGALVIGYLMSNNALKFTYQSSSLTGGSVQTSTYYPSAAATCVPTSTSSTC
jgi:hypothetical protein